MSDGPYKSLPLPRCWKKLAQRLENNAYSSTDVDETFHHELSIGFKDIPFEQVKNILLKNNLFKRELINDLDKLKDFCAGSDIGIRFIDFVKIKYQKESKPKDIVASALKDTLDIHMKTFSRSIQEHYLRKDPNNSLNMQNKLTKACKRISLTNLVDTLINNTNEKQKLEKHQQIEDGPSL